jgi:hypothetical protein
MTFLQPFILWGLPLLLLPLVIHLLNRMRYRSQPWGAMRLLLAANRSSISQAKLRQFLILLFRVLAIAALLLFVARPIAGGWMGWMFSPAPDNVLILLDRSASMETRAAGSMQTKREQALKLISQATKSYEGSSHFILIDSAIRNPQEIASINSLAELSLTAPTDTAADIPAMLQTALNWIVENRAGASEIWIASDLQLSNWQPNDARFKNVLAQLGALPQRVRVRLLALNQPAALNSSITVSEVSRRPRGNESDLQFALDIQRNTNSATTFPLATTLDGAQSHVELNMDGQAFRWRHRAPLGMRKTGGFGSFQLPADANTRDNAAYFVYGMDTPLHATVIANDKESGRILKAAVSALSRDANANPIIASSEAANISLDETALLIWQGALPEGEVAERVRTFVSDGGVSIFFPPAAIDAGRFNGLGWSEPQSTEKFFHITRWDEAEGPLAKTDEGLSLPLGETEFPKRQLIVGQKNSLAAFSDAETFLARQSLGKGEIYFCASLPNSQWSTLADGPVLVPMLQRLLQAGGRRLQQVSMANCGELSAVDRAKQWTCIDSTTPKNIELQAGVYRSGERLIAVNRPAVEDEPEILDTDETRNLFRGVAFQLWDERTSRTEILQREIWRVFLFAMLVFLFVEGMLLLPKLQAPRSKFHAPIEAATRMLIWMLILGVSLELGTWCLEFFA